MATRNETRDVRQQERLTGEQGAGSQQTGNTGGEIRSDRERGLRTSRERPAHTGVVRSDRPGWGLSTGGSVRSPFALMRRMMDDMDRMFEEFGLGRGLAAPLLGNTGPWGDLGDGGETLWTPAVEVLERGDKLVVRADIPGVSKDDVNVNITNDALTIEGERREESEDRGEGFYRSERSYGRFLRTIPLPEGVDTEKAEANFKDGVLEVTLPAPKTERKRGRKIAIR